jgi:hypothetical protein
MRTIPAYAATAAGSNPNSSPKFRSKIFAVNRALELRHAGTHGFSVNAMQIPR